jgi:hypothetical protein
MNWRSIFRRRERITRTHYEEVSTLPVDVQPESQIEGQSAAPASSSPLPEVPFPAEYTGAPAREADGQHGTADRRMTYEQCVAALQEAEGLIDSAKSACSETIAAFEKDGPVLVANAQKRLQTYCLPDRGHEKRLIDQAQQVEVEIQRLLPYPGQFAPLLALISGTTDSAITALMDTTIKRIQALPSYRTAVSDTMDVLAMLKQFSDALKRGDDGSEISDEELMDAKSKMDKIQMDNDTAVDFLKTMAECGFLAGTQIAASLQTIAGYIDARSAYLMTYLEATDYSGESDDAKQQIAREGAIQLVYDAITTAVGQYAPLMLPKLFAQIPLIGGGFAILDVARTINEKRKLVEERKSHLLELAKAHQERGDTDEIFWLDDRLDDDRKALDDLVKSTVEMCDGLMTLARFPQADPPGAEVVQSDE